MTLVYEQAVGQDLNLGTGIVTVTNPGGGALTGTQISLSTFGVAGANGSATTATWDPASILATQSVTTTVTVEGASLGDFVMVSFSLDLSGCTLSGYVSSANTVTVVLSNPTTSAVDLSSGTVKVLVYHIR